jgi:hypothetical protein
MGTFPKSPYLVDVYEGKLNLDALYSRVNASGYGFDNQTPPLPCQDGRSP